MYEASDINFKVAKEKLLLFFWFCDNLDAEAEKGQDARKIIRWRWFGVN